MATLGHVRGRGPMDTSSAKQDEVDIGRDGADGVGGTEPRPRGFPPSGISPDRRGRLADLGGDEGQFAGRDYREALAAGRDKQSFALSDGYLVALRVGDQAAAGSAHYHQE